MVFYHQLCPHAGRFFARVGNCFPKSATVRLDIVALSRKNRRKALSYKPPILEPGENWISKSENLDAACSD